MSQQPTRAASMRLKADIAEFGRLYHANLGVCPQPSLLGRLTGLSQPRISQIVTELRAQGRYPAATPRKVPVDQSGVKKRAAFEKKLSGLTIRK